MAEQPPLNRFYVASYAANDRDFPIVAIRLDPRVAGYRVPEDLSPHPDSKRYPNHVFTGSQPSNGDERVTHIYEILPSPWVPFTRYDDDLGPVQGRRRSVKNEGQVATLAADKRVNYEAREGSAIVYTEIEETWSIETDEDGNSLFPVRDRDFYDPSRGAVQERRQLFVPTGEEQGTLENINGVITQTSYEPYNEFLSVKIVQTYSVSGPKLVGQATDEARQLTTITTQRKGAVDYVAPSPTATKTVEVSREDAESLVERIVEVPEIFKAETYRKTKEDITPQKFKAAQEDFIFEQNVEGTANSNIFLNSGEFLKSEEQINKFVKRVSVTSREITSAKVLNEKILTPEGIIGSRVLTLASGDQTFDPSAKLIDANVESLGDGRTVKTEVTIPNIFTGRSFRKTKTDLTPEKFKAFQEDTVSEENVEGIASENISLETGEFEKSEQQITEFVKRVSTTSRNIGSASTLTEAVLTPQGKVGTRTLTLSSAQQSIIPSAKIIDSSIESLGDGRTIKSETRIPQIFSAVSGRLERVDVIPDKFTSLYPVEQFSENIEATPSFVVWGTNEDGEQVPVYELVDELLQSGEETNPEDALEAVIQDNGIVELFERIEGLRFQDGDISVEVEQLTDFIQRKQRSFRDPARLPISLSQVATTQEQQLSTVTETIQADDFELPQITSTKSVQSEALGDGKVLVRTVEVPTVFSSKVFRKTREDITPQKFRASQEEITTEETIEGEASDEFILPSGVFSKSEQQVTEFIKRVSTTSRNIEIGSEITESVVTQQGQLGTRTLVLADGPQQINLSGKLIEGSVESLGDGRTVKTEVNVPDIFQEQSGRIEKVDIVPERFRAVYLTEQSAENVEVSTSKVLWGTNKEGEDVEVYELIDELLQSGGAETPEEALAIITEEYQIVDLFERLEGLKLEEGDISVQVNQVTEFVQRKQRTFRNPAKLPISLPPRQITTNEKLLANVTETLRTEPLGSLVEEDSEGNQTEVKEFVTATVDYNTEVLGDGSFIVTKTELQEVFDAKSTSKERIDLTPQKFRAKEELTTVEETREVKVDSETGQVDEEEFEEIELEDGEYSKREQWLTKFTKRVSTTKRDIQKTSSIEESVLTPQGQLAQRTIRLSSGNQIINPSAELIDGSIEELGDGRTVKTEVRVPSVFNNKIVSSSKPDVIPQQFRASVPAVTTQETLIQNSVSAPILDANDLEKSEQRVTEFTVRKTTTSRENEKLPTLKGQEYEPSVNIVIPYDEKIVNSGNALGNPTTIVNPISKDFDLVRKFDTNAIQDELESIMLEFPTRTNLSLPQILKSVTVLWGSSEENGSYESSGTIASSPDFSMSGSDSGSATASASVSPSFQIETESVFANNIPTTSYVFFLKYPVTLQNIKSKIGNVLDWPIFKPKSYSLTAQGESKSLRTNVGASVSISPRTITTTGGSSGSVTQIQSNGASNSVQNLFATANIPPCIHGDIDINEQGKNTASASASVTINISGLDVGWDPYPTKTIACQGTKPSSLSATSPSDIPRTGLYLIDSRVELYQYGYARIYAEVLDASVFA